VDWDGATLAPCERDLALFTGQGFERFLDDYGGDAGAHGLDPDLVAFFLLRRNLEDLVDWLGAALANDRPDEQWLASTPTTAGSSGCVRSGS